MIFWKNNVSKIINLPSFTDGRGSLTVIEKALPFEIKRTYFIYDAVGIRGGHRHIKTIQALICINGSCEIYTNNGKEEKNILLNNPCHCLILEPEEWHTMNNFSDGAVLLVFSSEYYDRADYIDEPYL